jgi:hypothetical protein
MIIPEEAFSEIITELERQPIENLGNKGRSCGKGRSAVFGVVNRRCLSADYSRNCWNRPYLYGLLLEFGKKYVPIPFNAITVNQNFKADKHRDKNNNGNSFLVGFGDYQDGDLSILEGDLSGNWNVKYKPLITDFSKVFHKVEDFTGNRYSLVYYQYQRKDQKDLQLPPPSVRLDKPLGKYFFYRGEEKITKKEGLSHPLKGRKNKKKSDIVGIIKDLSGCVITFD